MTTILEGKKEAIEDACRRHGVAQLHVFGSALRDDFSLGDSDVDLLVEFEPLESYAKVDAYFGFLNELRVILGRDVDLIMSGAVKNRYIARDIDRTKQMVYAS